jgi:hypothetical protein
MSELIDMVDHARRTVGLPPRERPANDDTAETVNKELLAACKAALPYISHFLGGWSTHTKATISTDELVDQLKAAIAKAEAK